MVHLPGVDNVEADHESRLKETTEWSLDQTDFDEILEFGVILT